MQVCTSLQTDSQRQHPTTQFFTGRMPFLPPNQQRQSTEGKHVITQSIFSQAGCPSCRPTNSVKALKANTSSLNQFFHRPDALPDAQPTVSKH